MYKQLTLLAATLAAALPQSAPADQQPGTVFVDNHCSFPVYLTSQPDNAGVYTLAPATTNAYNAPAIIQGQQHALTLSRQPDISAPVQAVFTAGGGLTYYSLSTKFGDPFEGEGFGLWSNTNGFDIVCGARSAGDCANTYSPSNPNGDNAVFAMAPGDLVLSLCIDNTN